MDSSYWYIAVLSFTVGHTTSNIIADSDSHRTRPNPPHVELMCPQCIPYANNLYSKSQA